MDVGAGPSGILFAIPGELCVNIFTLRDHGRMIPRDYKRRAPPATLTATLIGGVR
jgi:hypothetical protein